MEHVNGWCFRGIYKGGLWENDLHVSALKGAQRTTYTVYMKEMLALAWAPEHLSHIFIVRTSL